MRSFFRDWPLLLEIGVQFHDILYKMVRDKRDTSEQHSPWPDCSRSNEKHHEETFTWRERDVITSEPTVFGCS